VSSIQRQARTAGFLYLLLAVTAPWGLLYVPSKLIVSGNAAATAENLRASEGLLRLGIASELVHQILGVFVVLALYYLFKAVDKRLAVLLVILGTLLSAPIMFLNVLNDVAAQILASRPAFLSAFDPPQLDALAYFFLRLHGRGIDIASIFWGLWLFPFGLLVIRSGFIPRFLGYLLMIAGTAYVVTAFATLVLPRLLPIVGPVALPLETAELPIVFWLAIWGARTPAQPAPA
jgi:Domain of unknown function (DUF4386)